MHDCQVWKEINQSVHTADVIMLDISLYVDLNYTRYQMTWNPKIF